MKLVIVESPAKAKKIQTYLGAGYEVLASYGHVRDLPQRKLGLDVETFDATYVVLESKTRAIGKLRAASSKAEHVYLATDPDREGEAIAWHLAQVLHPRRFSRARFHEITPKGVKAAIDKAGPLDASLIDAQQARRLLDRIVGFKVSPLLSVLGRNHSAGRVQSAALHLVVGREKTRVAFKPTDYWTLRVRYANGLVAKYARADNLGQYADARLQSEGEATTLANRARNAPHVVKSVEHEPVEQRAAAPFTTSSLQQVAGRKLKFSIDKTMDVAQTLFEGGHISYHRTDSVALSEDAIAMARAFIERDFPRGLPSKPNLFRSTAGAQEAHEAIRPTSLDPLGPGQLSPDEAALYRLIRARFLACQCKPAVLAQTTVRLEASETNWRARGSTVQFAGWRQYWEVDQVREPEESSEAAELPQVEVGQVLQLVALDVEAKQTKPPPRFTLLSLAEEMQRTKIGRPSTVPTIAGEQGVLLRRTYVEQDQKKFIVPTLRGCAVDDLLERAFGTLVDPAYTSGMEANLDEIAEGKRPYKAVLRQWWAGFSADLSRANTVIAATVASHPEWAVLVETTQVSGKKCPRCKTGLLRQVKNIKGSFVGCSGFPVCKHVESMPTPSGEAKEKR